jgi:hypothetical protein
LGGADRDKFRRGAIQEAIDYSESGEGSATAINSRVNADAPNDKAAEGVTWSGIGKSQSRGARIFQLDTKRPPLSVDLDLKAMNENYAVVRIGGKTRVVSFEGSETHRGSTVPVFSTIPDFRAFHDRVKKQVGTGAELKHIGLGTWWINHSERTQYDGIVYAPEADPKGKLNLWKGFVCEPKEGSCDLYLQHVRENICGGHEEYFHYLIGWMAYAVQYPGKQGEVAVVLRGREGTGKGMFAHYFGTLFGPHFVHVSHASHLTGHFNAHLQYCSVLFADEAFFAGDRSHESVLKALITEPRIVIEPKGLDAFQAKNCISLIMASNSEWVVPAGADARRYFVLDVSDAQIQNEEYFAAIQKEADNGGREALLYYLQDVDLSQFKLRSVPGTAALADQKMRSRRGVDSLIEYIAHEGNLLCPHLAPRRCCPYNWRAERAGLLCRSSKVGAGPKAHYFDCAG